MQVSVGRKEGHGDGGKAVGPAAGPWVRFEIRGSAKLCLQICGSATRRSASGRPGRTPPARRRTSTASLTAASWHNAEVMVRITLGIVVISLTTRTHGRSNSFGESVKEDVIESAEEVNVNVSTLAWKELNHNVSGRSYKSKTTR